MILASGDVRAVSETIVASKKLCPASHLIRKMVRCWHEPRRELRYGSDAWFVHTFASLTPELSGCLSTAHACLDILQGPSSF